MHVRPLSRLSVATRMPPARDDDRPAGQTGPTEAQRSFERLYRRWWGVTWTAARPILPCDADASDAAQRVFVRLWNRVSKDWSDIVSPDQFFQQAGRREALLIQRERRNASALTDQLISHLTFDGPTPERQAARAELRVIVRRTIDELPPRCQAVMRLIVCNGFTHAEVAGALCIGVGAVEKQVKRAYAHLRKRLAAMCAGVECLDPSTFADGGGGEGT